MTIWLERIRAAGTLVLLALACLVLVDVHRALENTAGQTRYTFDNANRAIRETSQTIANLRHTTEVLEKNSQREADDSAAILVQATADLATLQDVEKRIDQTVEAIGAQAAAAIGTQSTGLADLEKKAGESIDTLHAETLALEPILKSTAEVTANAAKLTADPDLETTLHQVSLATSSLADASASFDRDMQRIEPVVKRATTPASLAARAATYAVDLVAKAGSILAGFVK